MKEICHGDDEKLKNAVKNCSEIDKKSSTTGGYQTSVKGRLQPPQGKERLFEINTVFVTYLSSK